MILSPRLIIVTLTCALAFLLSYEVLGDMALSFMVLLVVLCLIPLANRWRLAIPVILFYMTVSGFVTNVLHPSKLPLLALDMILLVMYAGFAMSYAKLGRIFPPIVWNRSFLVLVGLAVGQMFNPALPSGLSGFLVGLVGLKVLLFHVPLAVAGYHLISRERDLWVLLNRVLLFSLPMFGLGLFSMIFGLEWYKALGEGCQRAVVVTPGLVGEQFERIPSGFSRPQNYGLYCFSVATLAMIAVILKRGPTFRFGIMAMAGAVLGIVFSGSRAPVVWLVLSGLTALVLVSQDSKVIARRAVAGVVAMLVLLPVIGFVIDLDFNVYINRYESLLSGGMFSRIQSMFVLRLEESFENALFGLGTGSGSVASRHVVGHLLTKIVESEYLRFMVEFGLIGFVAALWWYFVIGAKSLSIRKRLRTIRFRIIASILIAYVITVLVSGIASTQIDQAPTAIFFWLFLGVLAKLPEVESTELAHARHPG